MKTKKAVASTTAITKKILQNESYPKSTPLSIKIGQLLETNLRKFYEAKI